MTLGLLVAFALGLVDALWNHSVHSFGEVGVPAVVAGLVGCLGGLVGALVGQSLVNLARFEGTFGMVVVNVVKMFGWTITGLAIGASVGIYDFIARLARQEPTAGAWRKVKHGLIGGALGGLVGSLLYVVLQGGLGAAFGRDRLRSPSAFGFVALGLLIGLMIGLAQIILKEAWVRIETGRRAGREMMLSKAETTIGRAESCDIGLFGDQGIDRLHARILLKDNRYLLADAGSAGGTFLNDQAVTQPARMHTGDTIRVGASVLRFGERQKRIRQ
jgi:hypothetical protein